MSTLGLVVIPSGEAGTSVGGSDTLLGGMSLLDRAVAALRSCPDVDHVRVISPAEPLPDGALAGVDVVVLHDSSFPLVDAPAVGAVLAALRADRRAAAAVAVLPVTDTLKQVAPDGAVLATVDRTGLRVAVSPQAYRLRLLPTSMTSAVVPGLAVGVGAPFRLPPAPPDAAALPRALVEVGRRVVLVDAPPAAFRVRTDLDLLAARALLGEA